MQRVRGWADTNRVPRLIGGLAGDSRRTFVFDLDGVVYVDHAAVPGAGEALTALDRTGHQVLFATNNSSRAVETVVDNIRRRTGYRATADAVITSGLAAADLLRDDGEICFVFGSEELEQTLIAQGIEVTEEHTRATAVVVGLDRGLSYQRLTSAVLAVRRGARFVATNDDATYPAQEGQYPGCGALVAAVERATGVSAVVCGKPNLPMQRLMDGGRPRRDRSRVGRPGRLGEDPGFVRCNGARRDLRNGSTPAPHHQLDRGPRRSDVRGNERRRGIMAP